MWTSWEDEEEDAERLAYFAIRSESDGRCDRSNEEDVYVVVNEKHSNQCVSIIIRNISLNLHCAN